MPGFKRPVRNSYWLSNDSIFKVLTASSGTDEVLLQELSTGKKYVERYATFFYAYKQVFKVGDVASWLNRTPRSLYRYESKGLIKKQKTYPVGATKRLRFYTLDDVWEMHEMISLLHQGRPRKDGRVVNNSMPDIGTLKIQLLKRYANE